MSPGGGAVVLVGHCRAMARRHQRTRYRPTTPIRGAGRSPPRPSTGRAVRSNRKKNSAKRKSPPAPLANTSAPALKSRIELTPETPL
jgi:hypothetical protein